MISGKIAKDVFEIMLAEGGDPREIVEARGLKQVTDTGAIEKIVDEVIAANPDKAEQAKAKPAMLGWFVGQVMKASGGKANPQAVNALLEGEARDRIGRVPWHRAETRRLPPPYQMPILTRLRVRGGSQMRVLLVLFLLDRLPARRAAFSEADRAAVQSVDRAAVAGVSAPTTRRPPIPSPRPASRRCFRPRTSSWRWSGRAIRRSTGRASYEFGELEGDDRPVSSRSSISSIGRRILDGGLHAASSSRTARGRSPAAISLKKPGEVA